MNRRKLSNQIIIAYQQRALLALELRVLRLASKRRMLVDAIALAQCGETLDDRVRAYLAARADDDFVLDYGVRPDANVRGYGGAWAYDGCWMCFHKSRLCGMVRLEAVKGKKMRTSQTGAASLDKKARRRK